MHEYSPDILENDPGTQRAQNVLEMLVVPMDPYAPPWHSVPSQNIAPLEFEYVPDLQSKQVLEAPDEAN